MVYTQAQHSFKQVSATDPVFFAFEDDFLTDNIRCIPMVVRFKLDACGIKLKLAEWSRLTVEERSILAAMPCSVQKEILQYRYYLQQLVIKRTGRDATDLPVESNPGWANTSAISAMLIAKLEEFNCCVSLPQWRSLSDLQRFVLIKLCRPGHENENFPKAVKEFGLV